MAPPHKRGYIPAASGASCGTIHEGCKLMELKDVVLKTRSSSSVDPSLGSIKLDQFVWRGRVVVVVVGGGVIKE